MSLATGVTKRFIEVMEYLIYKKVVKNKRQFAELMDTYPHVITYMGQGERNVTLEMICLLLKKFPVSAEYLITGKGEVYTKPLRNDKTTTKTKKITKTKPAR